MSKPTQKDAELVLQLYSIMSQDPDKKKAFQWLMNEAKATSYEQFLEQNPVGSEGYNNLMELAMFYETIGTLVNNDILSANLVFDWLYLGWDRLGPMIKGIQKAWGSPVYFENYELMVKKKEEWQKTHPPKLQSE